jgi:hypothetical protein
MYKKFVFMASADEIIQELVFSPYMNNYEHIPVFSVSRKAILYQKQRAISS